MPGPADLLRVAISQLGTTESPAGSNLTPYGAWFGENGVSWCDIFVSYVADHAGLGDVIWRSAYVPSRLAHARSLGQITTAPSPGDLACYDFTGDRIPGHIGIVESVTSATVTCIEGNTSSGTAGSQSNGGGVFRRVRDRSLVLAYIRPPYQEADMPLTDADAARIDAIIKANFAGIADAVETRYAVTRSDGTHLNRDVAIGKILDAVSSGSPVTLSVDQVSTLAAAVITQVGPAVAGQVAAELAKRLGNG